MIALLLALVVPAIASAADARTGRPSIFPLASRWTVDIGAPVVSNAPPVSDEHRVYIALQSGAVVAHALSTGAEVWRRAIATARPLALDGDLVFVASADGIHALRADTGADVWQRPSKLPTAPMVASSGWLLIAADGTLTALRGADGTVVWTRAFGAISERPSIDGDRVYVAANDGRVAAIAIETGTSVWQQTLEAAPGEPLGAGDRVYVGAGDRRFYCLKAGDGDTDWVWRVGAQVIGAPAVDESNVVLVAMDNVVRALDRHSGVQQWQHAIRHRASAGPVVIRGIVIIASSTTSEIYTWTAEGKASGTIATPAAPAVPPDVAGSTASGVRLSVVTGNLAGLWQLTLIAAAPELSLEPLGAVPGVAVWNDLEPPLLPLTELPGRPIQPW